MKKLIKSIYLVAISCLLIFTGCKKGDDGPAGATGPVGPAGPAGPVGTANIIYSSWMDTNPWTNSTTSLGAGKKTYYFDIAAPKITADIIDKGTVLVYVKFISDPDGVGIAKLLPSIYYNIGGADIQYRFQYGLFLNKIRVICDIIPNGLPSSNNKIRYIIIPGGVPNARTADYTKMSYSEVCQLYNIGE